MDKTCEGTPSNTASRDVLAWHGHAGTEIRGTARHGKGWHGKGLARHGTGWHGKDLARHGTEKPWHGTARKTLARNRGKC